jgi:hypothetical protein
MNGSSVEGPRDTSTQQANLTNAKRVIGPFQLKLDDLEVDFYSREIIKIMI